MDRHGQVCVCVCVRVCVCVCAFVARTRAALDTMDSGWSTSCRCLARIAAIVAADVADVATCSCEEVSVVRKHLGWLCVCIIVCLICVRCVVECCLSACLCVCVCISGCVFVRLFDCELGCLVVW